MGATQAHRPGANSSGRAPRPQDLVTSPQRRQGYEAAGHWDGATLTEAVARHANRHPGATAVVDLEGRRQRTYGELDTAIDTVVTRLRSLGVVPGDVVAVQLPNWYENVAVALGVLRAGAVLNPMVTLYRRHELAHMLGVAGTRVLVTPATYRGFDHAGMGAALAAQIPGLAHLVIPDPAPGGDTFEEWPSPDPAEQIVAVNAAEVSEVLFSSGTEAAPKAILHTEQTANAGVRAAARSLGLGPADVVWMPSPIGHSTGFNFGVRLALFLGLPLVLQDRWDAAVAADLVRRHGCTYTVAATTFLSDLVRHCQETGQRVSTLRLFGSGGAPVPATLVSAAAAQDICALRLYGSTEALIATCNRPASSAAHQRDTDGVALDGVEVEVRGADGRSVVGTAGEILVRGPACSVGFLNDPGRTAATFDRDGWVHSGDLGILDEEGYLTIVGRTKEIIIRGGMNVAPREIEDLIGAVPGVRRVAVVGLPDERLGEIGCACVVLEDGAALDLPGLVAYLRGQGVAAYKLPERLALFSELPATASGKIQKHRLLATLTADDAKAPAPSAGIPAG